jgi:hypothetical protein
VARSFRTISLRVAILALGLAAVGSAGVHAADAARNFDARNTGDLAARRHDRHFSRYVDRSLPSYYARPVYYRPYPYAVPLPFFLGFGFAPRR